MPIAIIPKNVRTILHFGGGDIHITDAQMQDGDGDGRPLVIFHETEPHPIGSSSPELHGTLCDDFAVGMTFTRPESIDAIISVLTDFKAKHFAASEQPWSNSGMTEKVADHEQAQKPAASEQVPSYIAVAARLRQQLEREQQEGKR